MTSCMQVESMRVLKRICGGRHCVSGRKNSVGADSMPYLLHLMLRACSMHMPMRKIHVKHSCCCCCRRRRCTVRVVGRYGSGCLEMASRGQACMQPSSTSSSWRPTEGEKLNCSNQEPVASMVLVHTVMSRKEDVGSAPAEMFGQLALGDAGSSPADLTSATTADVDDQDKAVQEALNSPQCPTWAKRWLQET